MNTAVREFGIPQEFLPHGSRAELLEEVGLTPQNIARYAVEAIAGGPSSNPLTPTCQNPVESLAAARAIAR